MRPAEQNLTTFVTERCNNTFFRHIAHACCVKYKVKIRRIPQVKLCWGAGSRLASARKKRHILFADRIDYRGESQRNTGLTTIDHKKGWR